MQTQRLRLETPHKLTPRQVAVALGYVMLFQTIVMGRRTDIADFLTAEQLAALPAPPPQPSIQDTRTICEVCHCELWVGPRQLAMAQTHDLPKVCMLCFLAGETLRAEVWAVLAAGDPRPQSEGFAAVVLNPDEGSIPRRA